jgi:hypothetical protein
VTGGRMIFKSLFGKKELELLSSLIGKEFQFLGIDSSDILENLSGVLISASDETLAIFSDYWFTHSEEEAVKHFELARFDLDPKPGKFSSEIIREGKHLDRGCGQAIENIFIVRSHYENVEYVTQVFKSIEPNGVAVIEFSHELSKYLDFDTDSGLLLVLQDVVIHIYCEHPYFELFQIDYLDSISSLKIKPQERVFENQALGGRFEYELLPVSELLSRF